MKKSIIAIAVLAFVGLTHAEMLEEKFTGTPLGATAKTNSYVIRGDLQGIHIDVTAPATNTVTVTDVYGRTLFTKTTIAADAYYPILVPAYSPAGVALTFVGGTNNTANVVYTKEALAGKVTCVILGENAAISNACTVTLIYNR